MTTRLPTPGSDDGDWGDILNAYLSVSLDSSGHLLPSAITQAGGVVVNGGGLVPTGQLGTGSASTSTYLRGDGSWQILSGSSPNATTGAPGLVQLAGDLGGAGTSATLPKVNFSNDTLHLPLTGGTLTGKLTVPSFQVTGGSPVSGQVLTADSSGNASWGTVASSNIVTSVAGLRALTAVSGIDYYLSAVGMEGYWTLDTTDSTSADNGGTIIVTNSGQRVKRFWFSGGVRPEWFGAKGDWVDTTATLGTGTDDSAAFQAAINDIIARDLGVLELSSKGYLINSTLYVNQLNSSGLLAVPFTMMGLPGNPAGSRGHSSRIVRNVTGDIMRVNLDSSGNTVLASTDQYLGFSCENVSFIAKSVSEGVNVTGIVAIRAFRTRCVLRNIYTSRLDYLMYQPDTDALANSNYCDHSTYDNIRVAFSTLSGMRLSKNDAGKVRGFVFDSPTSTITGALEMIYGTGYSMEGLLFHSTSTSWTPPSGSAYLYMYQPRSAKVSALHIERQIAFEATIDVVGGYATEIDTVFSTYQGNTMLRNNQSIATKLSNWYGLDDRQSGFYDFEFLGTAAQTVGFRQERVELFNYTGGAQRAPTALGAAVQGPMDLLSGSYFFPASAGGSGTSSSLGTGTLRVYAIDIREVTAITKLGAEITAVGDAGSTLRLGIWAEKNGIPDILLLDAGTIAADSVNVQDANGSFTQLLTPGRYFIGGVVQGVTTNQPTVRTCNAAVLPTSSLSSAIPTAGVIFMGFQQTGVTGALVSWTAGRTLSASGLVPRIHMKTA